jgi:DNA-binding NarL/FixJ family response regulator
MNEPIRVVPVDDHRLFRDGLRLLLAADARFEVAGQAASGEEFLELAESLTRSARARQHRDIADPLLPGDPDLVVFMDIDMPGIGGVEATRRALERWPGMRIIALSMHSEQDFYLPMVEVGAKGFLLKDSEFSEVAAAAEKVAAGGTYFSPELMDALVETAQRTDRTGHSEVEPLSERETEILPLVCEGLANHEIADRLFISKRTVDKHRANILAKTGCKNTASLVIYAVKNNLIKI